MDERWLEMSVRKKRDELRMRPQSRRLGVDDAHGGLRWG